MRHPLSILALGGLLACQPPAVTPPKNDCPKPLSASLPTQASPPGAITATLYNPSGAFGVSGGFAVIKEKRTLTLHAGINLVYLSDVAATIDATSVKLRDLTDPNGTTVLEQSFEYDLANTDRLLERYKGQSISLRGKESEAARGVLLSYDAKRLTLRTEAGIESFARDEHRISLEELPDGLRSKPTLVWKIDAEKEGEHQFELAYEASQIGWWVDYTLVVDNDKADLSAWVSAENNTGASWDELRLKLVAGNVRRVGGLELEGDKAKKGSRDEPFAADLDNGGFVEQSFANYHLYTFGRPVSLFDQSRKQLELFSPARGISIQKKLIADSKDFVVSYYGAPASPSKGVKAVIELTNSQAAGLGVPLPKGKLRAYQRDEDGSLEFLGEDAIEHTPRDEKLSVSLGDSFDVRFQRSMTNETYGDYSFSQTWQVNLANHKAEAVEVLVRERLYGYYQSKVQTDATYEKEDASTLRFVVPLAPGEEKTITYTATYKY